MKINYIQADITTVSADIIVNAANSSLLGGSGVDGAIHRKGGSAILEACQKIRAKQGKCEVGEAVVTTAGNLPATYVIHTVGPVWNTGGKEKENLLQNCYQNAMELAITYRSETIAFPCISTGIYRFPKELAATIAIDTISKYKDQAIVKEVIFVCFEKEDYMCYERLLKNET
ncbi:O-acetyl-ADP-ribose deacetylase [uncultured Dokdonia sp.]|uniref:O-acetyl-ADP-ribose deacetylase n=1 Tax=uncultured Dokdonia sp. TaxID=575653 RepID=UPI0026327007|nr:O-acetyl-ADP-ribose deacetylase [uncultured Dokdonia sp.]